MCSGQGSLCGRSRRGRAARQAWIGMVALWCVALALAPGGAVWGLDVVTQITPGATLVTQNLELSEDGCSAAFVTSEDILGTNPDNSPEVYHLDLTTGALTQLTAGKPYGTVCVGVSSDFCRVVFWSQGDLLGTNPDHSAEVYVVKYTGGSLTQLTSDPVYDSYPSGITDDGKLVVFYSEADLTGKNSDHSQEVFAIATDGTGLIQLTEAVGLSSQLPRVSADGSVIAFQSEADLTGGNPDASMEVFAIAPDGTGLRQLTDASGPMGDSHVGSVSGDGSVITFASYADLTGENPANVRQVFRINSDGTGLTQLTHAVDSYSWGPEISADGSTIVFSSGCGDLTGENPDEIPQAYRMNADGTGLEQLTHGGPPWLCSWATSISGDGSMVGVASYDDITGANPTNERQAFLFQFDLGLAQITYGREATDKSYSPSISEDGSLIAFCSEADLTGGNPDHSREVFTIKADGTDVTQLTNSTFPRGSGSLAGIALSADGSRIAFSSDADLTGGNPDHSDEVFVINADGTGLVQLSSDLADDSQYPTISGDGSLVTFEALNPLTDEAEVFVVNADGTGLLQLTSAPGEESRWTRISADGSLISFQSTADLTGGNPDGSWEVFAINPDGTGLTQVTDSLQNSHAGSVSSDGSAIVFTSFGDLTGENPANDLHIFLANSDGTGLMQLTHMSDAYFWGPRSVRTGPGSSPGAAWGPLTPTRTA